MQKRIKIIFCCLIFLFSFSKFLFADNIPIIVIAPSKKAQSISTVGSTTTVFDESYFGDRECQDFSYKVFDVGYKNYMIYVNRDHRSIPFDHKVGGDVDNFKDKVQKSYEIYNEKWANWENNKIMERKSGENRNN